MEKTSYTNSEKLKKAYLDSKAVAFEGTKASEQPTAVYLGGQPGSGKSNKAPKFTKEEMPEDLYELIYNPETLDKVNDNFKEEREECSKTIEKIRLEKNNKS